MIRSVLWVMVVVPPDTVALGEALRRARRDHPVGTRSEALEAEAVAGSERHWWEIVRAVVLKGAGWSESWVQFAIFTTMAWGGMAFATHRHRRSVW